jgi:hypothetical protein
MRNRLCPDSGSRPSGMPARPRGVGGCLRPAGEHARPLPSRTPAPRPPGRVRCGPLLAAVLVSCLAGPIVRAVDVEEVRWGFDGRVVPGHVNLLSVRLANNTDQPLDAEAELWRSDGLGRRAGAVQYAPCYLAPFTSRWLQFYPFILGDKEDWVLTFGRERHKLPAATAGPPAIVCLTGPADLLASRAQVRAFPDDLFPTTVAATDALHAVFLDYAPRWEPVRRQAFLDWLRRGGTVHLLWEERGSYPEFSGDLSCLNTPAGETRIGSGLLVRHQALRAEVSALFLVAKGHPVPELKSGSFAGSPLDRGMLTALARVVIPRHNWALIYLVLLVYVLAVGRLNYLLSKKVARPQVTLLFFLGSVAVFSLTVGTLGRRGHGEKASVHTLSYARPLGGGHYDVTQWSSVFVRRGAYYTVTHPADSNIYSTCAESDPVQARIQNGRNGNLVVDIPLYSSAEFMHRARMPGPDLGLRVVEWPAPGRTRRLAIETGPGFPGERIEQAWAVHEAGFTRMRWAQGALEGDLGNARTVESFLSGRFGDLALLPYQRGFYDDEEENDPVETFNELLRPVMARAIGGTEQLGYHVEPLRSLPDGVQLFILAPSPDEFSLTGRNLGKETGYVVYHVDVFRPED